jgi:hypothetical protein
VHPLLLFVHIYTGCTAPFAGLLIGWHWLLLS